MRTARIRGIVYALDEQKCFYLRSGMYCARLVKYRNRNFLDLHYTLHMLNKSYFGHPSLDRCFGRKIDSSCI